MKLSNKIDKFESKINVIESNQLLLLSNKQQIMAMLHNINQPVTEMNQNCNYTQL